MLTGRKILLTGPTSQVAFPIARALVAANEVHGLARFSKAADRARCEAIGVRCHAIDLATGALDVLPDDFDVVLNFAVVKTGDFAYDLAANAEGAGRLLAHCRRAKAFVHASSGGVYEPKGQTPLKETDALADNHRGLFATYSISKIAAETVIRFASKQFGVPATIARLSVPYGNNGGWPAFHLLMMKAGHPIPLHPDRPNVFNLLHEDDYIAMLPKLVEIASVGATTLNWGGSETASIEEWCAYLGELTGFEARFSEAANAIPPLPLDLTRQHELVGRTSVSWRDGIRRQVEARAPELLRR